MRLHPDFPDFEPAETDSDYYWDYPIPYDEIQAALKHYPTVQAAAPLGEKLDAPTLADLAEVTHYSISWHGQPYRPGGDDNGGSELMLVLLGTLKDGRWFALTAWNDYTGWGCQDHCDIRISESRDDVIRFGLDNEGRETLGLPLPA